MNTSAILKTFIAILLVGSTVGNIEAAKKRTKSRTTATATPTLVKGEVKNYGDALTAHVFTIKKGDSKISVEYPIAGNPTIVTPLRRQIVGWIVSDDKETRFNDLPTPDQLLKSQIKNYASKARVGMEGESIDEIIAITYSNDKLKE